MLNTGMFDFGRVLKRVPLVVAGGRWVLGRESLWGTVRAAGRVQIYTLQGTASRGPAERFGDELTE